MQNPSTTFQAFRVEEPTQSNPTEIFLPDYIRSFRDFTNFCGNEDDKKNINDYLELFLKTTQDENIPLDAFGYKKQDSLSII